MTGVQTCALPILICEKDEKPDSFTFTSEISDPRVGRIEGESNTRAVVQIKNNLAAFGHPKAFMLSETGFRWLGDYEITADEVLGGIAPKANKLEQAKQMLRELAETTNMVQSNEIFEMADKQGISKRTMENAKKELGIRAKKINNSWYWELDAVKQR